MVAETIVAGWTGEERTALELGTQETIGYGMGAVREMGRSQIADMLMT